MSSWTDRWNQFIAEIDPINRFVTAEDFMKYSFISLSKKYYYAETPKVGCSTIKKLLIQAEFGTPVEFENPDFIHYREFNPLLNSRQVGNFTAFLKRKDIFKFCFVRNPYTRLLSGYLDKIVNRKGEEWQLLVESGHGYLSEKDLSFEEFVDIVVNQPVMFMNPHWRIQYYQTFQSGIEFDFIGRFEQFGKDLDYVMDCLDIDMKKFGHAEKTHATYADDKVQKYYTPEIRAKVYEKYKIDFKYFGYAP